MTFDEWWEETKNLEDAEVPEVLKKALKELAYEAWCESRYHQNHTNCPICGSKDLMPYLFCKCGWQK